MKKRKKLKFKIMYMWIRVLLKHIFSLRKWFHKRKMRQLPKLLVWFILYYYIIIKDY